jgi:predicted nucleotidyltransferase
MTTQLTKDTERLRAKLLKYRKEIRKEFNEARVDRAYLFGSVARGDARSDSDIDIYVDYLDIKTSKIMLTTGRLMVNLRSIIGVKVDVITEVVVSPEIMENVRKDMVSLESICS